MIRGWQHKGSFVLKFKPETDVVSGKFEGRIEHVGSGETIRFASPEELVAFLYRVMKDVHTEFQQAETLAEEITTQS